MKPRKMKGLASEGMVLCATSPAGKVELLEVPAAAKIGERIAVDSFEGEPDDVLQDKTGKAPLEVIKPGLATDAKCEAMYKSSALKTSAGPVKAPTNASSPIG
eukprot:CAMPEP_0197910652 /NCGR_PEP_ID=MMETSP1439-20131203/71293_1 /TAXON_ID=66791 /ORGANISM="Gonyaulax spinifera, Strain CCMP409" /LENGTH=102 /DNA_ID=CAMNT_0043532331 /DNA_START=23 /DNA_END=331 /DNA_ORIENTATION=-